MTNISNNSRVSVISDNFLPSKVPKYVGEGVGSALRYVGAESEED